MKIFIVLSESPLKVRNIAIYCFLISFLVPCLNHLKLLRRKLRDIMQKIFEKNWLS